ncbi:MAG: hypothetical protein QM723_25240 [Myxococcaceae bacterium]
MISARHICLLLVATACGRDALTPEQEPPVDPCAPVAGKVYVASAPGANFPSRVFEGLSPDGMFYDTSQPPVAEVIMSTGPGPDRSGAGVELRFDTLPTTGTFQHHPQVAFPQVWIRVLTDVSQGPTWEYLDGSGYTLNIDAVCPGKTEPGAQWFTLHGQLRATLQPDSSAAQGELQVVAVF